MKRSGPLKRTGFTSKRKPMKARSDKRKAYRASDEGQEEAAYMLSVKGERCCICDALPPSDAHHPIHDRYGTAKVSGFLCIPLCKPHHQDGPEAIHNGKETWRKKHGPDHGYVAQTQIAILGKVRE